MHEGQVTSSTMGDALDRDRKDRKQLADPSLRFPHLLTWPLPSGPTRLEVVRLIVTHRAPVY